MSCIKTGARVFFPCYVITVIADLYEVGDAIIVRSNPNAISKAQDMSDCGPATHTVDINQSDFSRDDIGIFVVPRYAIKEN